MKIIIGVGIAVFILHWLIPSIRKRIEFEIEFACAIACLFAAIYVLGFWGKMLVPLFPIPGWVTACGVILWLLSIVLFILSVVYLRVKGKPESGWEKTTRLSTAGLHGFVRHPMQLGAVLGAVGISLTKPAAPIVILCLIAAILGVFASFAEDTYNISKFGNQYREYMERVPRLNLVLGIWRRITRMRDGERGTNQ